MLPFAPLVGLSEGFEISEWGAHDTIEGRTKAAPSGIEELLTERFKPHPFSSEREGAQGPADVAGLRKLTAACLEGVRLRGELAARLIKETRTELSLIVFPELHRAAHRLWHTVAPGHALYARDGLKNARTVSPTLADILREVDAQVARLVEAAGADASVLVFSLHGMQPARGLPDFLTAWLEELGLADKAGWETLSLRQGPPRRGRADRAARAGRLLHLERDESLRRRGNLCERVASPNHRNSGEPLKGF